MIHHSGIISAKEGYSGRGRFFRERLDRYKASIRGGDRYIQREELDRDIPQTHTLQPRFHQTRDRVPNHTHFTIDTPN